MNDETDKNIAVDMLTYSYFYSILLYRSRKTAVTLAHDSRSSDQTECETGANSSTALSGRYITCVCVCVCVCGMHERLHVRMNAIWITAVECNSAIRCGACVLRFGVHISVNILAVFIGLFRPYLQKLNVSVR
jgi:hypothetical protein